ncbi:MAG: YncE family protein, partial [Psychrobacter sp.]
MVGMEPVAVAFKDNDEIWVVNHLSDSVSVVSLTGLPRVVETLQVGDEPRDIVFAGKDAQRAFITAAFRGQNHPEFSVDALLQPGLGRADVWVMDASDAPETDRLITIVNLFSDTPRALAVSPNGERVYAAAFMSGNQTTALSAEVVAGVKPLPTENHQGESEPETGLIVQKRENRWVDERETDWSA